MYDINPFTMDYNIDVTIKFLKQVVNIHANIPCVIHYNINDKNMIL